MSEKRPRVKTGYSLPKAQAEAIKKIAGKYGIVKVRIFGSVARGEANPNSDLDLLVDLPPKTGLLKLVAIKNELQDSLQRPVDIVTEKAISPYIREQVLLEAVPL